MLRYAWVGVLVMLLGWAGVVLTAAEKLSKAPAPTPKIDAPEGFVLLLTGNWAGQLEPCGCTEKQLGGIDRRTHILDKFPVERTLLVDNGPLVEEVDRQGQLKFGVFLRSLKKLKYEGISLSPGEIARLGNIDVSAAERPTLICTNMPAEKREAYSAVGMLEKTLKVGKKELPVVVLGVSVAHGADAKSAENLGLTDAAEAVEEVVAGISDDKIVVVLVSCVSEDTAQKVAEQLHEVTAVDLVILPGLADEPEVCNGKDARPIRVSTGKLGKYVVRMELPPETAGEVEKYDFSMIEIDSQFKRDESIVAIIDEYQFQMQMEDLVGDETAIARESLGGGLSFMGTPSCGEGDDCHADIVAKWQEFGHAQAMVTLMDPDVNRQFDPYCVGCHTVGMYYEGGFRSMEGTPDFAGVGCEMCHGPGSAHAEDPYLSYQEIFTQCEQCHDHEHSPPFDKEREEYFEKIKHWDGERKYWD